MQARHRQGDGDLAIVLLADLYWRATPTECRPFLGKPVSSTIQARIGLCRSISGRIWARPSARRASSDQLALATKWWSD
jgi:hypothetical protein